MIPVAFDIHAVPHVAVVAGTAVFGVERRRGSLYRHTGDPQTVAQKLKALGITVADRLLFDKRTVGVVLIGRFAVIIALRDHIIIEEAFDLVIGRLFGRRRNRSTYAVLELLFRLFQVIALERITQMDLAAVAVVDIAVA